MYLIVVTEFVVTVCRFVVKNIYNLLEFVSSDDVLMATTKYGHKTKRRKYVNVVKFYFSTYHFEDCHSFVVDKHQNYLYSDQSVNETNKHKNWILNKWNERTYIIFEKFHSRRCVHVANWLRHYWWTRCTIKIVRWLSLLHLYSILISYDSSPIN